MFPSIKEMTVAELITHLLSQPLWSGATDMLCFEHAVGKDKGSYILSTPILALVLRVEKSLFWRDVSFRVGAFLLPSPTLSDSIHILVSTLNCYSGAVSIRSEEEARISEEEVGCQQVRLLHPNHLDESW